MTAPVKTRGLTDAQVAVVCEVSRSAVRMWIYRKQLSRNEWGLIDRDKLWEFLFTTGRA